MTLNPPLVPESSLTTDVEVDTALSTLQDSIKAEIREISVNASRDLMIDGNDEPALDDDLNNDGATATHSDDDDVSETSTVIYDQEPFETFKGKVMSLAQQIIWPDISSTEIEIERLEGGGYNRIIGLARQADSGNSRIEHIIRIPRFEEEAIDRDVASILFVMHHTGIPTGEIIGFDKSTSNAIESPYMTQKRLQGSSLESKWVLLSFEQKCKIVVELASVYKQMLAVRSNAPGSFVLPADGSTVQTPVMVQPLKTPDPLDETRPIGDLSTTPSPHPYSATGPTTDTSISTVLVKLFDEMKEKETARFPDNTGEADHWIAFGKMALEMEEQGLFKDVTYSLVHGDLHPRNIITCESNIEGEPAVTGILDWDGSLLGPAFATCKPPTWIWSFKDPVEDDESMDELDADACPATEELLALKELFQDAVGPEYRRFAYDPAYRLARRLFRFASDGEFSSEDWYDAAPMLREWDLLCGRDPDRHLDDEDDDEDDDEGKIEVEAEIPAGEDDNINVFIDNDGDKDDDDCNNTHDDCKNSDDSVDWDQEPLKSYQQMLRCLTQQMFWPLANPTDIEFDQINGGGSDRLVGVTWISDGPPPSSRRFLRIRRKRTYVEVEIKNDGTTLTLQVPMPEVL